MLLSTTLHFVDRKIRCVHAPHLIIQILNNKAKKENNKAKKEKCIDFVKKPTYNDKNRPSYAKKYRSERFG